MKAATFNLLLVLLLGGFAYYGYYNAYSTKPPKVEFLDWVIQDFSLSEDQQKSIKLSHEKYLPICEQVSQELDQAKDDLIKILETDADETSLKRAHQKVLRLEKKSYDIAIEHIFEIAALMPKNEGLRYKQTLLNDLIAIEEHLPVSRLLEKHSTK